MRLADPGAGPAPEPAPAAPAARRGGLSRRAVLLLVAGGAAQLSLPRLAPPAPRSAAPAAQDRAAALLAAHAQALRTGVLAELDLAELGYRVTGLTAGEVRAELDYRLRGFDDYPAVLQRSLAWDGTGALGAESAQPGGAAAPWDLGPVRPVRGARCLVLGPGEPGDLSTVAGAADQAVAAVSAVWGTGWPQRLVLQLPSTEEQFARLLGVDPGGYQGIAAVTSAAAGAPVRTAADRVMLNPEAFRQLSAVGRQVVVTHECTHVATRADTHPWTPLWLSEGVADWTGYLDTGRTARQIAPELTRDVAAGRIPGALPADADFAAGSQGIAQAYEQAWLACDLIAQQHGRPALVALYRGIGAAGPGAGRDAQLDAQLRAGLGYGLAEFTQRWQAWTERQLAPQA
ncbi:hypothetical protein [Streptomyces tateyamensis]|uniref:hypothetical protein n=1 Tax=Streptomyces tateyamensis TaxID=565073 RepID=UPI0015E8DA45|nr:hypothetical protein [Streptomyces tateyamensis]